MKWAPGYFDTTVDLISDITQIPDMFTKGDYPYSWSGFAAIGPFKGLSSFTNNVHAQNTDSLSQMDVSDSFFGIDKEVYVGTILQNAANPKYRYDPKSGMKPSVFLIRLTPTRAPPGPMKSSKFRITRKYRRLPPMVCTSTRPATRSASR